MDVPADLRDTLGGAGLDPMVRMLAIVAILLAAAAAEAQPAVLVIEADAPGAVIRVDGIERGPSPAQVSLPAGQHWVQVGAPDRRDAERSVELIAGARERLVVSLEIRRTSILGRWWFWTGAVVIVGVALTGLILLRPEAEYDDGSIDWLVMALR